MYYRYWTNQDIRPAHFGIRNHQYKLAMFYGQGKGQDEITEMPFERGWEFYDLGNDPKELHNGINDPKYQDIIKEMKEELILLQKEYGDDDSKDALINQVIKETWNSN